MIRNVAVNTLHNFRNNPYGEEYEVISGHRRKKAAIWAGKTEVPVIIRKLDDTQAVMAMVDSNLHRENLKPNEKAFAYKMKLEAMKHQGKRVSTDDITLVQAGPKFIESGKENVMSDTMRSNELLAKQVGESVAQIKRYIRLTNLIPKILYMVDEGKIAFTVAVELSYLKEDEQYEIHAIMELEQCTPSLSQASRMKVMSQQGKLDMDKICIILEEEKPNQREQIKIRADLLNKYFPKDYTPKQKRELIEQLVKEWYRKQGSVKARVQ